MNPCGRLPKSGPVESVAEVIQPGTNVTSQAEVAAFGSTQTGLEWCAQLFSNITNKRPLSDTVCWRTTLPRASMWARKHSAV